MEQIVLGLPPPDHVQLDRRVRATGTVRDAHRRGLRLVVHAHRRHDHAFAGLEDAIGRAIHVIGEHQATGVGFVRDHFGAEPAAVACGPDTQINELIAAQDLEQGLNLCLRDHLATSTVQPRALAIWAGRRIGSKGLEMTVATSLAKRSAMGSRILAVNSPTGMCRVAGLACRWLYVAEPSMPGIMTSRTIASG